MGTARVMWLLALGACYQPSPSVGAPCDRTEACPTGQVCTAGSCQLPGAIADAAVDADTPAGDARDAAPASWSAPAPIPGVNSTSSEGDPSLTADRLAIVFVRASNLYLGTRTTVTEPFTVTALTALNTDRVETSPEISADGTTLYFTSDRVTLDDRDVYVAMRAGDTFGPPTRVAALSATGADDGDVAIAPDGLTAIIARDNAFFRATRATPTSPWDAPRALGIDLGASEAAPSLTAAGDLYFHADSTRNLYVARRQGTGFGPPAPVTELNTDAVREAAPFVSADERYLWFESGGNLVESRR